MVRFFARLIVKVLFRRRAEPPAPPPVPPRPAGADQDKSFTPYKRNALNSAGIKAKLDTLPLAKVVYVIDGDTVVVERDRRQTRVRLDSIDCPEDGQDWGDIAQYGLIKLVGGAEVRVEAHGFDDHRRLLATIYVRNNDGTDWLNVNERMVALGHAWVMRKYYDHLPQDRQHTLNKLESWARSKRVGLWRAQDPTPPWRWRRQTVHRAPEALRP